MGENKKSFERMRFSVLLVFIAFLVILAGCKSGGEEEASSPDETGFNESGLPIVDDEITITIAGDYDSRTGSEWNELDTIKEMNEGTNVNIDWQLVPSDWDEKRSVIIGSGDLPDVMLKVGSSNLVQGGEDGMFIPLEDLIEKYAPNLNDFLEEYPEVEEAITAPDGHIYSLPRVNMAEFKRGSGNSLWINEEWLDKVDMDMPETTDEFKNVLQSFKENDMNDNGDPDDEVPLTARADTESVQSLGYLYGSFGTLDETFIVKNDKVEFVRATSEYKDTIKYLHSLYKEGLIDDEAFALEGDEYIGKISSDPPKVGSYLDWSWDRNTNIDAQLDYGSPVIPLEGPNGDQVTPRKNPQMYPAMFAITKENENPKATMRWVDQAYEPEMSIKLRQGPNRIKKDGDEYDMVNPPEDEDYTEGEWQVKETPYNHFVYAQSQEQREAIKRPDAEEAKEEGRFDPDFDEWTEELEPYMEDWVYPDILFSSDQYKQIDRYETDIKDYTEQMRGEWITKGGIEEDWDSYISDLKQMGLEDYTEIYQDAYDTNKEQSK